MFENKNNARDFIDDLNLKHFLSRNKKPICIVKIHMGLFMSDVD